jgi:hypothetical protein
MVQRWSWLSDSWQDWFFKRVPEGWVVSLPSPWMLGRRRHYLVSEAQRADIIAFFGHVSWAFIVAVMLLGFIWFLLLLWAHSNIPPLWNDRPLTDLIMLVLFGFRCGGRGQLVDVVAAAIDTLRCAPHGLSDNSRRAVACASCGGAGWLVDSVPASIQLRLCLRRTPSAYSERMGHLFARLGSFFRRYDVLLFCAALDHAQNQGRAKPRRVTRASLTPASASARRARPWIPCPGSASASPDRRV